MSFLLLILLAPSRVAAAPCPVTTAALACHLETAYRAYVVFDLDRFATEIEAVRAQLGCLDGIADPGLARELHLGLGLAAWLDQEPQALAAAARAVLAVDPAYVPGPEIAPEGSRLRAMFVTAREAGPGGVVAVEGPPLWVDGAPGGPSLPEMRAALVQWNDPDGAVRTWYLDGLGLPADLLFQLRLASPPAPRVRHRSRWLVLGGAAAATTGVAALWGAHRAEVAYWESYDATAERRLYATNRALGLTGWGLLAGSGAATVGAITLGEF